VSDSETSVRDAGGRYVISVAHADAGFAEYFDEGDHRVFLHTEVAPEYGGRGLAGILVRAALDDVRAQGRRIVNFCPYIKVFVQKNDDWNDLIDRPTPAVLEALRGRTGEA
jgi:predicted GNAT family acetyltransferase